MKTRRKYTKKREPTKKPKRGRTGQDLTDWLWKHTDTISIPGCFLWTGKVNERGYGITWKKVNQTNVLVFIHRLAYTNFVGPIRNQNHLHHLCHNPACWNPEHLAQMTPEKHMALHGR